MRKIFHRIIPATVFFVFSITFVVAVPQASTRRDGIAGDAATRDFHILNALFARAHATAFKQIPAREAPNLFKDSPRVSIREFIVRILQYYRALKVDHTGLGLSPELIQELGLQQALFPYPLKFLEGRAFFDCDAPGIPFGSELIALNGDALPQLMALFEKVSAAKNSSGQIDNYRLSENFAFLYYLSKGSQTEWRIQYTAPRAKETTGIVKEIQAGVNSPVIRRHSTNLPQYAEPLNIMFNPKVKGAYLAINTFMPEKNRLDSIDSWNNWLNLFQQEARTHKAENLVIDLRVNRGGVMLFSAAAATWFIDAPVSDRSRSAARSRVLPYTQFIAAINGLATTPQLLKDTENHLQTGFADKMVDGYFETRQSDARYLEVLPNQGVQRFKKIFVLIGPATYSAAVNFARLLKLGNKNVVLVGDTTGSPGDGHSAEVLVTYKLPATGIFIEVPLMRVLFAPVVPGQLAGQGLKPDVVVQNSIADFIAGNDSALEYASRAMAIP
ncbi:MAG: hypothetical protein JSR44_09090 [Spirochaetes bacterium]|nr:hypothetical protein [Spirochaetota bacterium]